MTPTPTPGPSLTLVTVVGTTECQGPAGQGPWCRDNGRAVGPSALDGGLDRSEHRAVGCYWKEGSLTSKLVQTLRHKDKHLNVCSSENSGSNPDS